MLKESGRVFCLILLNKVNMKKYLIAELIVGIRCFGKYLEEALVPYEVMHNGEPDMTIIIQEEKEIYPEEGKKVRETDRRLSICTEDYEINYRKTTNGYSAYRESYFGQQREVYGFITDDLEKENLDVAFLEYRSAGFFFSRALMDYNGFCLHASAIAVNNQAILFSGPSNVGKSTHTGLWKQYFGKEKVSVINDDNPAIRLKDEGFYAYGTPFCGSSGINENRKVPLKAIVFLEQAPVNTIERVGNKEAAILLFNHTLREKCSEKRISKVLELYDVLLKFIPVYKLKCRPDQEAIEVAYQEILGETE